MIICDPQGNFDSFDSIRADIENARRQANLNFTKAFKADVKNVSFIPQIARCKVQDYFNHGEDDLEKYDTKNLGQYTRDHDLKFDQIAYPSIDGFIFGERIYN